MSVPFRFHLGPDIAHSPSTQEIASSSCLTTCFKLLCLTSIASSTTEDFWTHFIVQRIMYEIHRFTSCFSFSLLSFQPPPWTVGHRKSSCTFSLFLIAGNLSSGDQMWTPLRSSSATLFFSRISIKLNFFFISLLIYFSRTLFSFLTSLDILNKITIFFNLRLVNNSSYSTAFAISGTSLPFTRVNINLFQICTGTWSSRQTRPMSTWPRTRAALPMLQTHVSVLWNNTLQKRFKCIVFREAIL